MSVEVITFGCRLNAYESEAIKRRAAEAQLQNAVVVNTCAVTAEAVRQSRQTIRRLRRARPGARIIVTGCAAQTEPQIYAAMPEVDLVLGNTEKLKAESYAGLQMERVRVNDIMSVRETAAQMVDGFECQTRAFLQVQNGCDHRCTFCIIPYGRGNSRSVGMGEVVDEALRLTQKGFAEIVLTGVNLTSYGHDLPGSPSLGMLVRRLLKLVPDIKRLRLSSLDSIEADPLLFAAIAEEERLMPHFHLSAQSGDDLILKRMKRRHSRADTIAFCRRVRALRPETAFGADLIAGFPTESEAMFQNSLDLVADAGLSILHVFPFSPRAGTPAARMPQLDRQIVRERAARLRHEGEAALTARFQAMIGSTREILVEKGNIGHTSCFAPVRFEGQAPQGALVNLALTGTKAGKLTGRLAE
ncbi:MAG TPA: tRNA (N(6)-L-threonylcarbamoyladenosine(37)-C(2))-methylthiotransferase MtaB [Rhizomicrobium sp.]|nr:tRNA (N(6)-L-threonylcarbamoyladenosine(37)-C(2))-methylthiotransferase MtaB [Rhizomicrobium sp.]